MNRKEIIDDLKEKEDWKIYLCRKIHSFNQINDLYIKSKHREGTEKCFFELNNVRAIVDYALYNFIADIDSCISSEKTVEFESIIKKYLSSDFSAVGMENEDGNLINYIDIFP